LSVQTAAIEGQFNRNIPNGPTVAALVRSQATAYADGPATGRAKQSAVPAVTPAPAVPPGAAYKVGDQGPAGGLIFFDMGFYMDGWRYLEAAPQDFPTRVQWGDVGVAYERSETGIGTGKQNTSSVLSRLKNNGQTMRAAQVVGLPQYGGYDDWFLPSRDELGLMYENLKKQRIGGFSNDVYWSSSGTGVYIDVGMTGVWQINFFDGRQINAHYYNEGRIRAVRQF
jgi:hypothetical protein